MYFYALIRILSRTVGFVGDYNEKGVVDKEQFEVSKYEDKKVENDFFFY